MNPGLTWLDCSRNALTRLDVMNNIHLYGLRCQGNALTQLDVSKNTELEILICFANNLTQLDISKNTELFTLECDNNNLSELDISQIKMQSKIITLPKIENDDNPKSDLSCGNQASGELTLYLTPVQKAKWDSFWSKQTNKYRRSDRPVQNTGVNPVVQ